MLRSISIFTVVAVGLFLVGCSTTRPGKGYSTDIPDEIERLIKNEHKDDIFAVGRAIGPNEGMAIRKAKLHALGDLAIAFKTQVNLLQKSYEAENNGKPLSDYQNVVTAFATVNLEGARTIKPMVRYEKNGTYTARVLVALSQETFKALVDKKLADYTSFRSSQAYKELETKVKAYREMNRQIKEAQF